MKESNEGKNYCGKRLTKKQCVWMALGSTLCAILFSTLLGIYVIAPAIIQMYTNQAHVILDNMEVGSMLHVKTKDTPFNVTTGVTVHHKSSPVTATILPSIASVLFRGKLLTNVSSPQIDLNAQETVSKLQFDSAMTIANLDVMNALSGAILANDSAKIQAKSRVTTKALGLTFKNIILDKTLTAKGFNNFQKPAPTINMVTLAECHHSYLKMIANATLENKSQVQFKGIGKLNVTASYNNVTLGYGMSASDNLALVKGNNTVIFEITVVRTSANWRTILELSKETILGRPVKFHMSGDNEYVTTIPILKGAMRATAFDTVYTRTLHNFRLKCIPPPVWSTGLEF